MRENIGLYRGKRKDTKEWVEGFYVKKQDPLLTGVYYHFILVQERDNCGCLMSHMTWYKVDPETVGQYIDKKVKGVKVFKNDIARVHLEIPYLPSSPKVIDDVGVIRFDTDDLRYYVVSNKNKKYAICYIKEVIGNIHDNPELLEVRENG